MALEVEQKYPVSSHDVVRAQLTALGCRWEPEIEQVDRYFAHPARDFAKTDEALRLRQCGDETFVTYKGPKLDPTTKTRREIELPIADLASFSELLTALGFEARREVRKRRTPGIVPWQGREIQIALDEVASLGSFIELEIVTEPAGLESAKGCLHSLAEQLQLSSPERRGYLQLLLAREAPSG
jgi:adenylate cyclase class 2